MECLIKRLFRRTDGLAEDDEDLSGMRLEYDDPVLWDAHVDVIKRRMSKLRKTRKVINALTQISLSQETV